MSTGLGCEFIEIEPGRWYYLLEDWPDTDEPDPSDDFDDWREHATAYGPFATEAEADRHLTVHHANPGAATITRYEPGFEPDETLAEILENAQR